MTASHAIHSGVASRSDVLLAQRGSHSGIALDTGLQAHLGQCPGDRVADPRQQALAVGWQTLGGALTHPAGEVAQRRRLGLHRRQQHRAFAAAGRIDRGQGLGDSRGKTSQAPAIMTSKAACGLRTSESCSTLVCTAEGQGGTQSSGRRDEHPASAPPRSHAPAGNTRMS
jgi:hypothetical protein